MILTRHGIIRIVAIGAAGVLAALGLSACASGPPESKAASAEPALAPMDDAAVVAKVIELHNQERAKAGRGPLMANPQLEAAARFHARDMAEHAKLSHEGSDGSTPFQRIERAGYHGRAAAENVAYGQPTPESVVEGWMNSPSHKTNILGDYSEIGVARALSKDGTPYWTTTFGLSWPRLDPAQAAVALVEAINRERTRAKLSPLEVEPKLEAAAREHAQAQAEGKQAANSPSPFQRAQKAGYRFRKIGAILAVAVPTAEAAIRSFMESAPNKQTLLGDYSQIGVGYATAKDGTPHWCIILARPL